MTSRNLLHKSKLSKFQAWLIAQGHEVRAPPNGQYQLCQIRLSGQTVWHVLYFREHMPEHISVVQPLVPTVRQWLNEQRTRTMPSLKGSLQ